MNAYSGSSITKSGGCGCGGSAVPATNKCSCGGGGCNSCQTQEFVRPNFFAGQLLTEEDLQSLNNYVVAKNRLHNRSLFGAGVVCGLDVHCHPCGGGKVTVNPGYALDCCGNDIAVTCATELDINKMIRDLRRDNLGGYDCGDPCEDKETAPCPPGTEPQTATGADPAIPATPEHDATGTTLDPSIPEIVRHYCLYVRYCEQESDPVTPYATDEPCGYQTCQATRIREGFRFELRCPPKKHGYNDLLSRICGCVGDVVSAEAVYTNAATLQHYEQAAGMVSGLKIAPETFTPVAASAHATEIATARKGVAEAMGNLEKDPTDENIDKALDAIRVLNTYPSRFLLADEATQAELSKNPTFTAALNAATEDLKKIRGPLEKGFAARPLTGLDKMFAETLMSNAEELSKAFTVPSQPVAPQTTKKANGNGKKGAIGDPSAGVSVTGDMRRRIDLLAQGTPYSPQLDIEKTARLMAIREELLERMEKSTHLADCELLRAVRQIRIPEGEQGWSIEAQLAPEKRSSFKLREAIVQYFKDCVCGALNPPCQPCDDKGVLLACLEVQDCEVLRICNLERTFVLNGVTLRYWFSLERLGDQIEKLCCPQPKPAPTLPSNVAADRDETRFVMAGIAQLMKVCGLDVQDPKARKSLGALGSEQFSLPSQPGAISSALSFGPQLATMLGRVSDTRFSALSQKNADLDVEVNMLKERLQKLEAK